MKKLIKKNLLLNKKNIFVGVLLAFFFATIAIDGHNYYAVAIMMSPSLLFSFVVGKMCYIEDSISTEQFLLSLPISKRNIIFEKNILSYICIFLGIIIVNLTGFTIDTILNRNLYFNINLILIVSMFLIIHNTIYIWLNYKYDFSKTQLTTYILLVLMFILFRFGNNILQFVTFDNTIVLILPFIATIILNFIILGSLVQKTI